MRRVEIPGSYPDNRATVRDPRRGARGTPIPLEIRDFFSRRFFALVVRHGEGVHRSPSSTLKKLIPMSVEGDSAPWLLLGRVLSVKVM